MTGPDRRPTDAAPGPADAAVSFLAIAVPGALLGLLGSLDPVLAVLVALGAAAVPVAAARGLRRIGPTWPFVPTVALAGILGIFATPSVGTAVIAAALGLGIVYGVGRAAGAGRRATVTASGLLVPLAGTGLALATALLIVPSQRLVGVAALLLVAAVGAIAFLLADPERWAEAAPAP